MDGRSGRLSSTTPILDWFERVSRFAVYLGGASLIAVAFLVTLEVVLRKLFLIGLSAAFEVSSYVLAVSTAWGYAFALIKRAHVRVDAIVTLLPRRVRACMDVFALLALTWLAAMLVWHGHTTFAFSLSLNARSMTPLGTPLWIPQGLWLLGLAVFLLTCIVWLIASLRLLAAGRLVEVTRLIGAFSVQEEAEEEKQLAAPGAAQASDRP